MRASSPGGQSKELKKGKGRDRARRLRPHFTGGTLRVEIQNRSIQRT